MKIFLFLAVLGLMISGAAFADDEGRILFVRHNKYPKRSPEIYSMRPDGSDVRQLTDHTAEDLVPVWSPDRSRIAFVSGRAGNFEIHTMNADGSDVQQLTFHSAEDRHPDWSPDGKKIVFDSDRAGKGQYGLYVLDLEKGGEPAVIENAVGVRPVWSPDGEWIAYNSPGERLTRVEIIRPDGTEQRTLTGSRARNGSPDWSPDSKSLVFMSSRDSGMALYLIDVASGEERKLTNAQGFDMDPAFSPDGKWIVFSSNRQSTRSRPLAIDLEIYKVRADGTDPRRLTDNDLPDGQVDW